MRYCKIGGDLSSARRHHRDMLRLIRRRSQGRGAISTALLSSAIRGFLASPACKAVALAKADPTRAVTEHLFQRAEALDALGRFKRKIPWRYEARKSGPPRCVVDLPWELNAVHRLAAEILYAVVEPGPHIYHWRGTGRDHLALRLAHLLRTFGQHVILADVRQCFASVNVEPLTYLNPLPPELFRNALDYRRLRFRRFAGIPEGMEDGEETVPRGLLEGSAASNPLLATLFNDLPSHLDERVEALLFGDNIAIVASSEGARGHAEENLVRYFAEHFAGPFSLSIDRFEPKQSFEWLGYSFDYVGSEVSIHFGTANWLKALGRLRERSGQLTTRNLEQITQDLLRGFPAISPDNKEVLLLVVADHLASLRPDPAVEIGK